MSNNSRVTKSIKNAQVAVIFYVINLLLQFFYRKVFLDYLGPEVLGLNSTAMNLLQFLNLAELGIGAAVSYSLYSPLANNDKQKITEIVSLQGYLYSRIGIIVLSAATLLMFFFPIFFSGIKIPIWYSYATFVVLLISALAGYFLNYQQIVLTSDQKEYKLTYTIQAIRILKVILQITLIYLLSNGYVWWLILELIASVCTIFGIKYVMNLEYPWLKTNIHLGKQLMHKYPEITRKTKQLFTHKIAGFALNQGSPLIIFAFTSLSFVSVYGNYLLVIAGITALLGSVFNSINAGVGNLVSEGNMKKILSIFEELFAIRYLLACVACYGVYKLTPIFITYWVSKEYLLPTSSLILMVIIMYINITRQTVDSFLNAYGLFNDVGAPIIETIINIGLSILLGYFYGINGILIGVIASLLIIVFCWKPFFLFQQGFKLNIKFYILMYIKLLLIVVLPFFLTEYLIDLFKIDPYFSLLNFLLYTVIIMLVFFTLLISGLLIFTSGIRQFYERCKAYLVK